MESINKLYHLPSREKKTATCKFSFEIPGERRSIVWGFIWSQVHIFYVSLNKQAAKRPPEMESSRLERFYFF